MMINSYAMTLLRLLRRWSVGSIDKFSQELGIQGDDLLDAVLELKNLGMIDAYPINDSCHFNNEMLEITSIGVDFLQASDGEINLEA